MSEADAWNGKSWQELLQDGLAVLKIPAEDTIMNGIPVRGATALQPLLSRYMDELDLFNRAFDLVGADSRTGVVVRHILDSLSPWKQILSLVTSHSVPHLADAGTGAGLPGIPLSLLFPELPVTLIERMSRRCAFLENCCALLSLKNTVVLNAPIEQAPAAMYSLVVFRAFRPLDKKIYRALNRLLTENGHLAAWKGKKEKIDEEMDSLSRSIREWQVTPAPVPFLDEHERFLVTIPQF